MLSEQDRRRIQQARDGGDTLVAIAEREGVSLSTVYRALKGRPSRAQPIEAPRKRYRSLKRAERKRIRIAYSKGAKVVDLAAKFDVSSSTISRLVRGLTHTDD